MGVGPDGGVAGPFYIDDSKQHRNRNPTTQPLTKGTTTMKNVTITDITSKEDVVFEQDIDTDTVIAGAGGVAVNGNMSESAVNTGRNTGIIAGDDVDLEDSIVGDGNTQINDSDVGAFAGRGNATNIEGENVNTGSGDLLDVDSRGDAQVVTGNQNDVTGDVEFHAEDVDGPVNFAVGDENRQSALEDNSLNLEDNDTFRQDLSFENRQSFSFEDNSRDDVDLLIDGDDNNADVDLD